MYQPRKLQLYSDSVEGVNNYCGGNAEGYYTVYGRSRDSDLIVESNWKAIITGMPDLMKDGETYEEVYERLIELDEKDQPPVMIWRVGHWLVGWCELLIVHESQNDMLEYGDECIDSIESYPVLDEGLWSDMEYEKIQEEWNEYECEEFKKRLVRVAYKRFREFLNKKEVKKIVDEVDSEKLLEMWFEMGYDTYLDDCIYSVEESVIAERFQPFEKLFVC